MHLIVQKQNLSLTFGFTATPFFCSTDVPPCYGPCKDFYQVYSNNPTMCIYKLLLMNLRFVELNVLQLLFCYFLQIGSMLFFLSINMKCKTSRDVFNPIFFLKLSLPFRFSVWSIFFLLLNTFIYQSINQISAHFSSKVLRINSTS